MAKIDGDTSDQSSTSQDCRVARHWMTTYYDGLIIPLRFFSDQEVPRRSVASFDPAEDSKQVGHLRQCEACDDWLQSVCEPEWIDRQRRLSRYCCARLFGAVEEPKSDNLPIRLRHYAPERWEGGSAWELGVGEHTFGRRSLIINYCPFCGKLIKTPDGPS